MDDINLVVIGIVISVIVSVGIYFYYYGDDNHDHSDSLPAQEKEQDSQPPHVESDEEEGGPVRNRTNYAPSSNTLKKKDPTFRLGRGNVRARGSNILYNVKSGDGTPAEPIPSGTCSLNYHKKPHSTNNYLRGGFEGTYNTDYISRNTIPACILNPTCETLAQR